MNQHGVSNKPNLILRLKNRAKLYQDWKEKGTTRGYQEPGGALRSEKEV